MQKRRLHPSLNQYTWLEAGDGLLPKIPHEFGSKNACTWGEEGDNRPAYHMLLERPPTWETGLISCVARTPAALLAEITSTCCPSALGGHQYLHGCCVTSYSHLIYTTSSAQRGSQSHSVGRHEKCQAWASSPSCPLTAVEPQTRISAVWESDNVLHWRLYSVIFMGGKELEGGNTCPPPGIINAFLYEMRKACMNNP